MLETPVLFLVFNRPELTTIVFDMIRQQKPRKLYIAADGPRTYIEGEKKKCEITKAIVLEGIDWDCEVNTLFRGENLGCGKAVSQAITWFFNNEEEGIILEDDCIPNNSFFTFCDSMLQKYRDNENIMMVCGTSYQPRPLDSSSYYFSRYVHVWGWATWRRAWKLYSFGLENFTDIECVKMLNKTFKAERERKMWLKNFNDILKGFDTWDYQWMYAIWANNGICVIPWRNMISNIGFGAGATHTVSENSNQAYMKQFELFNIIHPPEIILNYKADRFERYNILITPPYQYLKLRLRITIKKFIKLVLGYKK